MNLQLADGKLQNPIGILEDVSLVSCGIEYKHSFAVVDFGREANYELILGRTFMRQFSMVQDWGYDYIYLRHECAITRVNLKNHSYRDVSHMPMDEFDSGSSECSTDDQEYTKNPNLWICGASKSSVQTDGTAWCRDVLTEDYMPCPFPEALMEPVEWIQCLATLDTAVLGRGSQFVDDDGYDVHPLHMISVYNCESGECASTSSNLMMDEVSVEDLSGGKTTSAESDGEFLDIPLEDKDNDWEVPEEEVEKIRLMLKHRDPVDLSLEQEKRPRKYCKSHQKLRRREIDKKKQEAKLRLDKEDEAAYGPPNFEGKTEYLYYVGAEDCVKMENQWREGFQMIKPNPVLVPKKARKKRVHRVKKLGSIPALQEIAKPTKVERKAHLEEQKRVLKAYSSSEDSEEEVDEEQLNIPNAFKKYTIQERFS